MDDEKDEKKIEVNEGWAMNQFGFGAGSRDNIKQEEKFGGVYGSTLTPGNPYAQQLLSQKARTYDPNRLQVNSLQNLSAIDPLHLTPDSSGVPVEDLQRSLALKQAEYDHIKKLKASNSISHRDYARHIHRIIVDMQKIQQALMKASKYGDFNSIFNGVPEHSANLIYDDLLIEHPLDLYHDYRAYDTRYRGDTPVYGKIPDQNLFRDISGMRLTLQEWLSGENENDVRNRKKFSRGEKLGQPRNEGWVLTRPLYELGMQMYDLPDFHLNVSLAAEARNRIQNYQTKYDRDWRDFPQLHRHRGVQPGL